MYTQGLIFTLLLICQVSGEKATKLESQSRTLGNLLNIFGIGSEKPETGTVTVDTLIKSSFDRLMKDPIENGMNILIKLFDKNQNYKLLFPFKDVSDYNLKDNIKFKVYSSKIMYYIKEIIDSLHDATLVPYILDKLAKNHIKNKIPQEDFRDLKKDILFVFKSLFSTKTVEAWEKLLDAIFNYIIPRAY